MRRNRTVTAVTASAVTLALTAGLGGASAASGGRGGPGDAPASGSGHVVTLLTGDRVTLRADGSVAAVHPAPGREDVPVRVLETGEATLVVPRDAVALIADGTLDRTLFDVGELSRPQYDRFAGTPLIVGYEDGRTATRSELRAEPDVELRSALDVVDADALTLSEESGASVWETLTDTAAAGGSVLAAAPGIAAVSLDRVVQSTLDTSTAQIGAPAAWAEGLDGTGTTIAVLDTGIAADHGDFEDKVKLAENFTDAESTDDVDGHGTHVASIAAGTGARSDGTYRGVAPGADLLNGKVLNDNGEGLESWIIEGMEWAADSGADIINMSLGGAVTHGPDPMADAVDRISAETDVLFVIAAGNDGPAARTIGTPGVADSALTVGSVDKVDEISDFSSVGPRTADGALKPEITAPGSDIGAAVVEGSFIDRVGTPVADGYAAISGTSMAAPHVAGAAAILAQANPDWTGEQLKNALTSSTAALDGPAPTQQGTGRLDVERALTQTVTTDTTTLDFGTVEYPSEQADPISRTLTYHNAGDTDITLDLALATTGPEGAAADGTFEITDDTVTVPAGGEATVGVTAVPAAAGGDVGDYGVFITATGDDQQVRAAGTVELEPEYFDLTLDITGREGLTPEYSDILLFDLDQAELVWGEAVDGSFTARLPEGEYFLQVENGYEDEDAGADLAIHPSLGLSSDTTVDVDLTDARAVDFAAPGATEPLALVTSWDVTNPATELNVWQGNFFPADSGDLRTLSLADAREGIELLHRFTSAHADTDGGVSYLHAEGEGWPTGLVNRPAIGDMAELTARVGGAAPGVSGELAALPETGFITGSTLLDLPAEAVLRVQASSAWGLILFQYDAEGDGVATYLTPRDTVVGGEKYEKTLNVGVFGPTADEESGVFQRAGHLIGQVSHFTDGAGNTGGAVTDGSSTLYRDGEVLAEFDQPAEGVGVRLPEGEAEYRLVSTAERGHYGYTTVSTEVTVDYTFTASPSEEFEQIAGPLAVRYSPDLALDSTAPAKKKQTVPLTVTGGEAAFLTVEASFDHGESWEELTVHTKDTGDLVHVHNPAAGGSVSLRATAEDADGNRSVQTIIDAYLTK
ncbi:S8 family serine peptidase [Streptomyces spiramenti]|uniref:S8 family serine peptidase n=1 Tax=Streptomyces spiramenti TaxID=2720606 RepID=A0ABX1AS72_9ACTN|nr:S8 family serine peptidase [Streptomyces spiramenti]NJP68278.1 S8 family serine peptidase [Streptomyces spiramenti]